MSTTHRRPRPAWVLAVSALASLSALLPGRPLAGQALHGVVRDADSGAPIPAATVSLLTPRGTALVRVMSDPAGRFRVTAPAPGTYRLEVRQIGYAVRAPQELRLDADGVTEVEVLLSTEPVALEAVVVETRSRRAREEVARGTPLRLLTRSDIEELERRSGARAVRDLARRFPGVRVVEYATWAGRAACIELAQRLTHGPGCASALVVVDGIPVDNGDLLVYAMSTEDVESIEILKPVEAGLRYGTAGGNGVVLINTRGSGEWARRQATASGQPLDAFGLALTGGFSGLGGVVLGGLAACGAFTCPFLDALTPETVGLELAFTTGAVPVGVHMANGRGGSLLAGLVASAGIGAAGYAVWDATGSDLVFLVTPLAQVVASVVAERLTSRPAGEEPASPRP